jgi:hypothetical protein
MVSLLSRKVIVIDKPFVYTISDKKCKPFTLQINKNKSTKKSLTKTTMVAFNKEVDAINMAYLLENHKRIQHDWPSSIFDGENDDNSFSIYGDIRNIDTNASLFELNIESWENEELQKYCIKHIMDILYIDDLDKEKNNKFLLSGKLYKIEADFQYYINLFNDKMKE